MNIFRFTAPDTVIGKTLVLGRAILDSIVFLIRNPSKHSVKLTWLILTIKPRFTMVRNKNLVNLYTLVQKINRDDIAGDIVECGVWNGGSSACMAFACRADEHHPKQRTSWLFDSFQGLPPTSDKDGTREQVFCLEGLNKGSQHKVQQVFRELGLSLDNVNIVPGWFDVTVPSAPIEKIALLHIDADWYESVKLVLDTLYDKVEPGGFVVLDDYNYWEGCNRALEDFFTERNLSHSILANPNRSGVYFQKPTS